MASFRSFTSSGIYTGITDPAIPASMNNTDVIAPNIKLYIEGIQVPFVAISVSQSYGRKPTADIQIPPESGLLDIIRGYEPKVHIFYNDANYGGDRLLFWGMITSCNYSKNRQGSGNTTISFHCEHKNRLLGQLTLDFSGWTPDNMPAINDPQSSQAVSKPGTHNSIQMVIAALGGIDGVASGSTIVNRANSPGGNLLPTKLDPSLSQFEKRFMGIPSISINLWNQLKINCYRRPLTNMALETMYIPLVEEGIGYFKRTSGHYLLELQVQSSKGPYCHTVDGKEVNIMVPPTIALPIISADQKKLAAESIANSTTFSGELTSFEEILQKFYGSILYEIVTLSSPAEIEVDPEVFMEDFSKSGVNKSVIETIIKPQLPFYYSPICNVLLPRMYSSISINQEEDTIPTRVTATFDSMSPVSGSDTTTLSYRGPASIREAVAYNAALQHNTSIEALNLKSTIGYSYSIPGKYEQGKGIKPEMTGFPWWLTTFSNNKSAPGLHTNSETIPQMGTPEYDAMMLMTVDWRNRNGILLAQDDSVLTSTPDPSKYGLNPYDPNNNFVEPHERLFYSTVDYEYTKRIAGSRSGVIEAVFNPYIIPGYPMDVIDDSPNHPSFHGLCTSVTHSITSGSITTSVSIAAATTYAELSNYYSPPSPPFLQTALKMVNGTSYVDLNAGRGSVAPYSNVVSTLLQNPVAKASADTFYRQVLGVGAAAPEDLIHFPSGQAYPVDRKSGIFLPRVLPQQGSLPDSRGKDLLSVGGRSLIDYFSTVGNLRLVSRPIESKDNISSSFKYNFVDLNKNLYNSTYVNYRNPNLASSFYLEPGASLFLDYMETIDFINAAKAK